MACVPPVPPEFTWIDTLEQATAVEGLVTAMQNCKSWLAGTPGDSRLKALDEELRGFVPEMSYKARLVAESG
eukprot:768398-Hanusia_phi.AAC.2